MCEFFECDCCVFVGVNNWKQKAQERESWRRIIEQAETHKEL